jgi:predicted transcriptional regulator
MMGAPRTFPSIVEILKRDAGKMVTVDQIAQETKLTEQQVRSAISENRKRVQFWRDNINVLARGHAWSLLPAAVVHADAVASTTSVKKVASTETSTPVATSTPAVSTTQQESVTPKARPRARTTPRRLNVGDLLEVIGYSGQDILARAEESGQVYRVTEL